MGLQDPIKFSKQNSSSPLITRVSLDDPALLWDLYSFDASVPAATLAGELLMLQACETYDDYNIAVLILQKIPGVDGFRRVGVGHVLGPNFDLFFGEGAELKDIQCSPKSDNVNMPDDAFTEDEIWNQYWYELDMRLRNNRIPIDEFPAEERYDQYLHHHRYRIRREGVHREWGREKWVQRTLKLY
ncbi:hypothetical protein M011DRAFT_472573 [Sporormia fimetaria CBS 119925]|uniref:Uncharacterized protein n=1 Tax=Sporormia fimetaria CBS 119925 TaxID=1340428 RepID=A0A6A6UXF5_9PLEO|nr:hypothetical protein M011DRAFT_472573 [Sporormia fimetaria CBS 119925]